MAEHYPDYDDELQTTPGFIAFRLIKR
jgi:hypothetical protein